MKYRICLVFLLGIMTTGSIAHAELIVHAYDGFDTAASMDANNGIYSDDYYLRHHPHGDGTISGGNIVGYGQHAWVDHISTSTKFFVPTTTSLSHGEYGTNSTGGIKYYGQDTLYSRSSYRKMNTTPADQTLFISGLIRTDTLDTSSSTEGFWMGFSNPAESINVYNGSSKGIMFGIDGFNNEGSLTVKGGGATRRIQTAEANTTYMVVLKIAPNLTGNDYVEVFVNPENGIIDPAADNPALVIDDLDFISSMTDLDYMTFNSRSDAGGEVLMDELQIAIPEPATIGLIVISSAVLIVLRHHMAQ